MSDSPTPPSRSPIPDASNSSTVPVAIVGIGASAGGLEALEVLFRRMPPDLGMAFVVVQHLSPDFRSMMDELLGRCTFLPVVHAEDGLPVEANRVYLMPPKVEMIIANGKLHLTQRDPTRHLTLPIDAFFRSLAQDVGPRSVGVVLSGTGSDGSRGIRNIAEAGGLVIAQTEETARFDGMPKSARESGCAHLVLAPEEIPAALRRFRQALEEGNGANAADELGNAETGIPLDENALARIFRLLRDAYGIEFGHYKPGTVARRTERRVQLTHASDLEAYSERLAQDPAELDALYRDLLIGVTQFFRDPAAFRVLEADVLDSLFSDDRSEFRAWIAGCATGEEAYSLAMLVHEKLDALGRNVSVKIFATDVHRESLAFAAQGKYPRSSLSHVHPDLLKKYFTPVEDGYRVTQELRQSVVFAYHNLLKDAPFTNLDLVSCRNLLIYLEGSAQQKALSLFHFGVRRGGILFLGASETPSPLHDEFETLDTHWKIFRKRRDVRLPALTRLPIADGPRSLSRLVPLAREGGGARPKEAELIGFYDSLLAEHMPPALLVDENRQLLHSFGGAGRYLVIHDGRATGSVIDQLDADLRMAATAGFQRALNDDRAVTYQRIPVNLDSGRSEACRLTVRPVKDPRTRARAVLFVFESLEPLSSARTQSPEPEIEEIATTADEVAALRSELKYTKENLQALVEELEASNEELQASNEELVASNEELQSTNEELNSVNEELFTVNAEHQKKISELTELTSDMENLLRSSDIHTIFLDRELRIRKFTPAVKEFINLAEGDIGRPIEHFTHRLPISDPVSLLRQTIENDEPLERDFQGPNGTHKLLRIHPYHDATDGVHGVVLTLLDVTALKEAQDSLRASEERLHGTFHNRAVGIGHLNLEGRWTVVNTKLCQLLGYSEAELLTLGLSDITHPDDAALELHRFLPLVRGDVDSYSIEKRCVCKDGRTIWVDHNVSLQSDQDGRPWYCISFIEDVSSRKRAENALRESEARFRDLADSMPQIVWTARSDGGIDYFNKRWFQDVASGGPQEPHRGWVDWVHPSDRARCVDIWNTALETTEPFQVECRLPSRRSGSFRWYLGRAVPVRSPAREFVIWYGSFTDIHEQRLAQDKLRRQATELSDADRKKDEFLAVLGHELRNPLAGIDSGLRVLKQRRDDPKTFDWALDVMSQQVSQLVALLNDLLDLTRVSRGKIALRKKKVDVADVVARSIECARPLIDERRHDLKVILSEDLELWADPTRIEQILANLLTNAAKYTDPGGSIEVDVSAANGRIVFRVRDSGIGIPADQQDGIFESFRQLSADDHSSGGLGIGLTLVKQLTELHGGEVSVESEGLGKGSVFTVAIPKAEKPAVREEKRSERRFTLDPSVRVIVVDDNVSAARGLSLVLENSGCSNLEIRHDGLSAIEAARRMKPDVMLVDIGLPDVNGYEVARQLRDTEGLEDLLLIAISGFGHDEAKRAAREAGFNYHLTKPADIDQLLDLVSKGNEGGQAQKE